jgi:hypothetical protein
MARDLEEVSIFWLTALPECDPLPCVEATLGKKGRRLRKSRRNPQVFGEIGSFKSDMRSRSSQRHTTRLKRARRYLVMELKEKRR